MRAMRDQDVRWRRGTGVAKPAGARAEPSDALDQYRIDASGRVLVCRATRGAHLPLPRMDLHPE
jgi:hypothetical protein